MNWLILLSGFLFGGVGAALLFEAAVQRLGRGRRSPRCPKCRYDMAPMAAGPFPVQCPECGREFRERRQLFATSRRGRLVVAGLALIVTGLGLTVWSHARQWGLLDTMPKSLQVWVWPLDYPRISDHYMPDPPLNLFERIGLRFTTDVVLRRQKSDIRTQQALMWLTSAKLQTDEGDAAALRISTPGQPASARAGFRMSDLESAVLGYRLATSGVPADEAIASVVVSSEQPPLKMILELFGVTGRTPEQMRRTRELIDAITPDKIGRAIWGAKLTTTFTDSVAEVLSDAMDRGQDEQIAPFIYDISRSLDDSIPNGPWLAPFRRGMHSSSSRLRQGCAQVFQDYQRLGQSEAIAADLKLDHPSAHDVLRLLEFRVTYCKDPLPRSAIEALFKAIESPDQRIAYQARNALDEVPESDHPRVVALLDHPSASVRELACQIVGRLRPLPPQVIPKLEILSEDPNQTDEVRTEARRTLKWIRPRPAPSP